MKKWVTLGLLLGSTIGGFLPMLWGDSGFGGWGIFLSTVGAIVGIWAGFKLGQYIEG